MMKKLMKRLWQDEQGLELSEYAIMAGLIIVVAVATIILIGGHIDTIFGKLETALGNASEAAVP